MSFYICTMCSLCSYVQRSSDLFYTYTSLPENDSVPEKIIFETISETAFLHRGWEELVHKRAPLGPMGPLAPWAPWASWATYMGPLGPMGPLDPMGPMGPLGPLGPMRPMGPMGPMGPRGHPEFIQKLVSESGPSRIHSESFCRRGVCLAPLSAPSWS